MFMIYFLKIPVFQRLYFDQLLSGSMIEIKTITIGTFWEILKF